MKIEIIRTKLLRQKYHFRIVASNGRVLASSEKYYNLQDCIDAAISINPKLPLVNKW